MKNDIKEFFAETDDDAVMFYRRCGFQTDEFYKTYNTYKAKRYKCTYCSK